MIVGVTLLVICFRYPNLQTTIPCQLPVPVTLTRRTAQLFSYLIFPHMVFVYNDLYLNTTYKHVMPVENNISEILVYTIFMLT